MSKRNEGDDEFFWEKMEDVIKDDDEVFVSFLERLEGRLVDNPYPSDVFVSQKGRACFNAWKCAVEDDIKDFQECLREFEKRRKFIPITPKSSWGSDVVLWSDVIKVLGEVKRK